MTGTSPQHQVRATCKASELGWNQNPLLLEKQKLYFVYSHLKNKHRVPRTALPALRGDSIQKANDTQTNLQPFSSKIWMGGKIKRNFLKKSGLSYSFKGNFKTLPFFPKGQTGWERSVLHPKEQRAVLAQRAAVSGGSVKPLPASICSVQPELGISSFQLLQTPHPPICAFK